ncbi:hypothetical protein LCGC14_0641280 [marine sediment metagenome]|uniref:Uncharacterized protein n=1 Tax=marine sediment metagenome TaxID=412755 RepID=A0A0F9U7E3_9ZZZZ
MKPNQIIQGDTLKVLKKMPSDLVDTIITSQFDLKSLIP